MTMPGHPMRLACGVIALTVLAGGVDARPRPGVGLPSQSVLSWKTFQERGGRFTVQYPAEYSVLPDRSREVLAPGRVAWVQFQGPPPRGRFMRLGEPASFEVSIFRREGHRTVEEWLARPDAWRRSPGGTRSPAHVQGAEEAVRIRNDADGGPGDFVYAAAGEWIFAILLNGEHAERMLESMQITAGG